MLTPAQQLTGKVLEGGWTVVCPVARPATATGGHFSHCYVVEGAGGTKAFLKALDYSKALELTDPAPVLYAMTQAYIFERDLLMKCRGMDRVVRALAHGAVHVEGAPAGGAVQYLIFEMADGDLRLRLSLVERVELAWLLRSLHHIATGIQQLHEEGIAHQDLKPSNVLVFNDSLSKVADLGRASYKGHDGPNDELTCAGDISYAPPEALYGYADPDWTSRRHGCDAYLLGSMVVFLFTGVGATALLVSELDESHHWTKWRGDFDGVLPYLRNAFGHVVDKFSSRFTDKNLRDELKLVVTQLCEPDPRLRGDPANRLRNASPFSMERYITRFDLLARRVEIGIIQG